MQVCRHLDAQLRQAARPHVTFAPSLTIADSDAAAVVLLQLLPVDAH
jgi:hypothetical protein